MLYTRATRLLQELQVAHGDGSFGRRLAQLARLEVLVLDDLAIAPIAAQERQDLLELLDDRVGSRSTLITRQLPTSAWHQWLGEPTIAVAAPRSWHGRVRRVRQTGTQGRTRKRSPDGPRTPRTHERGTEPGTPPRVTRRLPVGRRNPHGGGRGGSRSVPGRKG